MVSGNSLVRGGNVTKFTRMKLSWSKNPSAKCVKYATCKGDVSEDPGALPEQKKRKSSFFIMKIYHVK